MTDDRPSIEARLIQNLRRWWKNQGASALENTSVFEEIKGLLEWYICECVSYGPNELGGWWSDGIVHLEITSNSPFEFKLLGVTWISCDGVAPFEIDVELDPQSQTEFLRVLFHLGMLDSQRRPLICAPSRSPNRVLENRPRYNRDWAMAVELTPDGQSGVQR